MSMYAIQDTTLTALGDAVRNKTTGKAGLSNETIKCIFTSGTLIQKTITAKYSTNNRYIINNIITDDTSNNTLFIYNGSSSNDNETIYQKYIKDMVGPIEFIASENIHIVSITSTVNLSFDLTIIPLDENGNEFKYTPLEMVDKINGLNMNPVIVLPKIISRVGAPYYSVTKEDLGNITKIGGSAFYYAVGLNSIELPDTVQSIENNAFQNTSISEITLPAVLNEVGNSALSYCSNLTTVRILNDTSVITCPIASYSNPFYNCNKLTSIYIPSKLYDAYCSDAYWSQYTDKFIAVGEWAFDPHINPTLLFNQNIEVSIQLQDFANTPEFSITSSNEEVATISNVSLNGDNTLLTYTINSLAVEGSSTITVNIVGENNTFNFTNNVNVFETVPEPTYEVVAVDGATYGFALREDGYWESQNFKKSNSASVCQVNISNLKGVSVYFDCINYAEANYDYGLLGAVNQVLSKTNSDDSGIKKNFNGLSKVDIQTVEYTDATGDCFIQVKFKKDGSGDQDNDSIRFKVRFGE